jgi:hypothetical protein
MSMRAGATRRWWRVEVKGAETPTQDPGFTVLRRYRGCPWRIGRIVAAALVLLHHDNHRTT